MSALVKEPLCWKISKVENTQPFGLQELTIYQDQFNPHTDYIDWEIGEMYADYYLDKVTPETSDKDEPKLYNIATISASTNKIKIGGSYKLLTTTLTDHNGQDLTNKYLSLINKESWKCYIDDVDMTDSELITWLEQSDNNKIKIKFADDRTYLTKILTIKCTVDENIIGTIDLQLS